MCLIKTVEHIKGNRIYASSFITELHGNYTKTCGRQCHNIIQMILGLPYFLSKVADWKNSGT